MKAETEIWTQLLNTEKEYEELSKKGGKGEPVNTQDWLKMLGNLRAMINTFKWVLDIPHDNKS
jgi:hypothetical protein